MRISDWSSDVCSSDLTNRYQTLSRLLAKLAIEIETGEHVSDALDRVESEEQQFGEFSRQAREIWDAQIDTDAFRDFVAVVEKACPGRTFYRKQLLSAFHLAFSQNACNFSVPGSSEERRVGKECVRKVKSRWAPD